MAIRRVFLVAALLLAQIALGQTAAQLEQTVKIQPENLKARIQLAELRMGEGQFAKVVELLNTYTDQMNGAGFRLLAFAYSNLKDYANEVRVLKIEAERDDENFEWHMLLGQAYLKHAKVTPETTANKNLLTQAIQEMRLVLKIQPHYKPAFDLLLKTLIEQKNDNEAREMLMEGINAFGARPDLYSELCKIDANDGFLPQAVHNCMESIKLSPQYPDHYVYLMQAYYDQKEEKKAERVAVLMTKRFPNSEYVQWAAGKLFLLGKNWPVASRYLQAAVKADIKSARAQFGLAQALYEAQQEKEALDHFVRACKLDASSLETFLTAGQRLKQAGKTALGSQYSQAANTCR